MPYDISYEKKDDVVCIYFSSVDSKEEHFSALEDAWQLCLKHHCKKLLVDLSGLKKEITSRSIVGCFNFGESVAKKLVGCKIAHVLPNIVAQSTEIKFISTVEHKRGVETQEFFSVEDALQWLH